MDCFILKQQQAKKKKKNLTAVHVNSIIFYIVINFTLHVDFCKNDGSLLTMVAAVSCSTSSAHSALLASILQYFYQNNCVLQNSS